MRRHAFTLIELPFDRLKTVRKCKGQAFTLVELLVVVAIIALLISILLPSLGRAKEVTRRVMCLSNMRQMATAAHSYATVSDDSFPIAYYFKVSPGLFVSYAWDFNSTKDWGTGKTRIEPGLLWCGAGVMEIQQCPSFRGAANWLEDPYTGYNYNTSYVGHGSGESIVSPVKTADVRNPAGCALFGDGQYAGGANKFMRAPWPSAGDAGFFGRAAGTQGFRHLGKTNVAFCDGHAVSLSECYTNTDPAEVSNIAPGTGFLSSDNSMYDLE